MASVESDRAALLAAARKYEEERGSPTGHTVTGWVRLHFDEITTMRKSMRWDEIAATARELGVAWRGVIHGDKKEIPLDGKSLRSIYCRLRPKKKDVSINSAAAEAPNTATPKPQTKSYSAQSLTVESQEPDMRNDAPLDVSEADVMRARLKEARRVRPVPAPPTGGIYDLLTNVAPDTLESPSTEAEKK